MHLGRSKTAVGYEFLGKVFREKLHSKRKGPPMYCKRLKGIVCPDCVEEYKLLLVGLLNTKKRKWKNSLFPYFGRKLSKNIDR